MRINLNKDLYIDIEKKDDAKNRIYIFIKKQDNELWFTLSWLQMSKIIMIIKGFIHKW